MMFYEIVALQTCIAITSFSLLLLDWRGDILLENHMLPVVV